MRHNGVRGAAPPVGATTVALALAVLGCWAMVSCPPAAALAVKQDAAAAAAASKMYDVVTVAGTAGGGGGGGYQVAEEVLGRGRHDHSGSDKKLPFRTGANVLLVSPWLDLACDTASDPSPYGPYGPGGGGAADGKWTSRRRMLSRAGDADGKGLSYPGYDYGGDDDPAASMVWCNASIPDGNPQPYLSYTAGGRVFGVLAAWLGSMVSAVSDAAAAALGRKAFRAGAVVRPNDDGGDTRLRNSQWDLSGYVLMGTDFTSPDMFSGSTVFLKNQNTRKFCAVAADRRDGAISGSTSASSPSPPAGALLCDAMTSGDDTQLVVELVEDEGGGGRDRKEGRRRRRRAKEQQQEEEEEQGDGGRVADGAEEGERGEAEEDLNYGPDDWPGGGGGDDDWPSGGGGDWPGGGGGDDDKTTVLIRLRAPQNGMRYCAPSRRHRGSPIVCDLRHPDTSHRQLTTFKLVDAAPSYPSGPPRNTDTDASVSPDSKR